MRHSRTASLLAALAVATGLAFALPAPAAPGAPALGSPIRPDNNPTPLPGQINARVSPTQLITVQPGCQVARAAAESLSLLFARANADGISLGPTECYRPLAAQLDARSSACTSGNCACAAVGGTSNHGWGKAVDLRTASGPITSFSSAAYLWLQANAGRYGWNQPAAELPGARCPEPWHWEWVGDGGTQGDAPIRTDLVSLLPAATGSGYLTVSGLGAITPHGSAQSLGSAEQLPLNRLVVGAASAPNGGGYWLVASDGGIFAFGNATFHGSTGSLSLNKPIVGMAATPSGNGYWLVASDGGIFTFEDAPFLGSLGGTSLGAPVVGMAATPGGNGYWLVTIDGKVSAFGMAAAIPVPATSQPVVSIASTPTGNGYWLLGSEGAVATAGDAPSYGSPALHLNQPAVAIRPTPSGAGYWLMAADGGIFNFGDAQFLGTG